jgi:hypothetical protein
MPFMVLPKKQAINCNLLKSSHIIVEKTSICLQMFFFRQSSPFFGGYCEQALRRCDNPKRESRVKKRPMTEI